MAANDLLTKDLLPDPSRWRLSMMLSEENLQVVINSSIEDHALIYRTLPLDQGMSTLNAFEDLIYDNPLLLADFNRADLLIDTPHFTFLPNEIATDSAQADVLQALWPDADFAPIANPIAGTPDTLVMGMDKGLASFVHRTFLDTEPQHPISVLASYFLPLSRQGNTAKLYAHIRSNAVDVIVIDHRAAVTPDVSPLRLASSYKAIEPEDAAYFILAAAMQAGLSLSKDELRLCGDQQKREQVTAILKQAASYVMPVIFPSEVFRAGKEAVEAPFPLILLPLCG